MRSGKELLLLLLLLLLATFMNNDGHSICIKSHTLNMKVPTCQNVAVQNNIPWGLITHKVANCKIHVNIEVLWFHGDLNMGGNNI